ncbi:MAG TPA: hypothetical protein VK149_03470 [Sideroxyarcus sp.]|nr:hypothetical protein [Sideroxyarcus sp.]
MAPFIAALLKSGLGLVANAAIEKGTSFIEEKTGLKIDQNKEPDSDQLTQLKQFMLEHEEELQRIQLERDHISADLFKAALADTQGAREREMQIATSDKAPLLNKIVTPILAIGVLLLTFVLFGMVMFGESPVDPSRKDLLVYVLGALSTIATQVVAYYFGSSVGSKEKDAALKGLVK